ncbi:hypothetical protein MFIFM68171_10333 [Madurella fahalii]|uniref:Large ribosomal subunit protein mL67 n=1 Tax=Madurella fahalii TaxID=1157608 RepID=A0ABQ0GQV8_9PEZI
MNINSLRPLASSSFSPRMMKMRTTMTATIATAAAARRTTTTSPLLAGLALGAVGSRISISGSGSGSARYASGKARPRPTPKPKPPKSKKMPPEGHGNRIYVFNQIVANHIIYSFYPKIKSNRAFLQFPYTGKKLVPAKIRKDYWRILAILEFGEDKGDVGRSVFRGLRELKRRHELEWEDEQLLKVSKQERGRMLNDQRGNSVADIATLLAGGGKGNLMVVNEEKDIEGKRGAKAGMNKEERAKEKFELVEVKEGEGEGEKTVKLHTATIYWANEQDKFFAQSWTKNVKHVIGLPEWSEEKEHLPWRAYKSAKAEWETRPDDEFYDKAAVKAAEP